MLQASLLGQFDVRIDGQPVDLSSQPAQTLLAYLLLNAGVAVRREQLAGLLWPDSLESSARKNLRNAIWLVRKAIGDQYLVADKTTVAFDPTSPYELDVAVLEEQPPDTDPIALMRAVSVYRGDLLPGYYEDWVQLERERLRGVFERRSQRLLDRLTDDGQWSEVQRWAEHWIALGHVPEPAYRALMISYAAQGDLSHMVSAYRRCVNALEEELDVSPSTETQSLYQRLSQGEVPLKRQPARPQTPAAATDPRQRFVTQEILAVGGHGELFLGVDRLTEKPVVIKRLKKELMTQNPNFVQRFVREGEILRQLNHPNVVQMLAAYEKEGEYCIVMEYVPGGTLRDLLDKTPQLPPVQVLAIGLELADALSRSHHLDVIHRDIKPDNVLLAADGTPRLTDFGMARLERMDARLTQPGAIIGSPAYMSPEALRGESLDARSDIWSFGVLLFEMLAGFHPYDDPQVTAVLIKILNNPTPDLQPHCPDAPPALINLVRQMLVKERNGRIASMRQVAATLEAIQTDLTQGRLTPIPLATQTSRQPAFDPAPKRRSSDLPTPAAHLVGREQELEALHHWLSQAVTGTRQVLFVSGEAGLGKTALVHTFLAQAARQTNAWIGYGQCMEYRGGGEAYMPVLEALGRLCRGPDGETLVALLDRLAPTWLVQMPWFIGSDENKNGRSSQPHQTEVEILQQRTLGATRERMLREMAELLEMVTAEWPLILFLEDLHWADPSTLDLITWLAQRQEPARLLLLGTYRPADAKLHDHPLPDVVQDLCIHGQGAELNLSFLTETAVATYLSGRFSGATLPAGLAPLLYQRTGGNPLFMHNVVDAWLAQESLDVVDGQLRLQVEMEKLAVGVPENLQALIEQQFRQLKQEDRDILKAASVAGMEFSAALVAALLDQTEEEIEAHCTALVRRGTFLRPRGIDEWPDGTVAARFVFAHHLYQAVLYDRVAAGQQVRLHRQIGKRLEVAYGQQVTEKAAELADHFVRGRDTRRAVNYLQLAAEQALQRSAHQEAMGSITLALELLLTLPETPERMACELTLQAALAPALLATKGWVAAEVEQAYLRARDLARQLGAMRQLSSILGGLAVLYEFRGEYQKSQLLMEQRLELPHQPEDTGSLLQSHTLLACSRFHQGSFAQAAEHAQKGLTLYNPEQHVSIDAYYGEEPGIFCHYWAAHALWFLGYPDQAAAKVQNALTLAEELGYKFGLVHAQEQAVHAYQFRREVATVQKWAAATVALAAEQGFPYRQATAMILGGWALAMAGDLNEGLTRLQAGLAAYQATGAKIDTPYYLTLLAEVYGRMKRFDRSLEIVDAALALVRNSQGFFYEAEIHRLRGELLWQANGQAVLAEAEASFEQALHLARAQQAKSLELRATMSLARLWQAEGKTAEAHQSLASIYDWFSEGFDSPDLVEARALLQSLSQPAAPLPTRPPSPSTAALMYRHNLPVRSTAFVGREKELADIVRLLVEADGRLLTLTGPGGIGKTRLALAVGTAVMSHFPDGVFFVPLAPLHSAEHIVTTLAESVDFHFQDTDVPQQQLLNYLSQKQMLLLMDNFEHLLDGTELLADILQRAPRVKILVTSRERLNLSHEVAHSVGGLEFPDWATPVETPTGVDVTSYSAVQLLLQRVRQARPDFEPQPQDLRDAGRICRLVQGMPLAIVLAAGWLEILSLREIGDEIAQNLDFLETEMQDLPLRQRSVRAVFDASWKRLPAGDQDAFKKLSIFRGGFTRQAAQAVATASLKTLRTLANNSFITVSRENRYEIHELLRQYGQEYLETAEQAERVQAAHTDYYLKMLARLEADIRGRNQPVALNDIAADFENIRCAWEYAVQQQLYPEINSALETLHLFMDMRGRQQEGANLFRAAYRQLLPEGAADTGAERVRSRLLLRYRFMQAMSTPQLGEDIAVDLEACLAVAQRNDSEAEVALCLCVLGAYELLVHGDANASLAYLAGAYERFMALRDGYFTTLAVQWLSLCHQRLGNRDQFQVYTQQSLELARLHGNKMAEVYALSNLAEILLMQGEVETAENYLQDMISIADPMKLHVPLAHSKVLLALLHFFKGDLVKADMLLTEALDLAHRLNFYITVAFAYGVRALLDSVAGRYVPARQFGADSLAISANHGLGLMTANWALATVYVGQQQPVQAWQQVRSVMAQIQQEGFVATHTWLLPVTAVLLAHSGAKERAVELLALAHTHPLSPSGWLAHWSLLAEVRAGLEQALGAELYQAAWARGQGLDLDAVVMDLLALELLPETAVGPPAPSVEQEIHFCVSADSVRLAYATAGEGPPLVKAANWLSHLEFDLSSSIWQHWVQGLSRQHTLLRYDERGCGLSSWEVDDFSVDAWVQDLEAVVATVGLERFPLFGISQGAAVATAYAARHPQKVSHLILCGGFVRGFRKQALPPEQLELSEAMLSLVKSGWGRSNPAFRQLFTSLFIPGATAEQMRWFNDLQRASTSPENAFRFLNAFYDLDVTHLAAQVQAPTLILHARRDGVIPFKEGQEMAARIPNARFVSLESQNHILLEDEPAWQKFLAEFHRFVDSDVSNKI